MLISTFTNTFKLKVVSVNIIYLINFS